MSHNVSMRWFVLGAVLGMILMTALSLVTVNRPEMSCINQYLSSDLLDGGNIDRQGLEEQLSSAKITLSQSIILADAAESYQVYGNYRNSMACQKDNVYFPEGAILGEIGAFEITQLGDRQVIRVHNWNGELHADFTFQGSGEWIDALKIRGGFATIFEADKVYVDISSFGEQVLMFVEAQDYTYFYQVVFNHDQVEQIVESLQSATENVQN